MPRKHPKGQEISSIEHQTPHGHRTTIHLKNSPHHVNADIRTKTTKSRHGITEESRVRIRIGDPEHGLVTKVADLRNTFWDNADALTEVPQP